MKPRVIAFYLPQFHPFKENDEWWGKGFTEWTNVGKAKPLFKGHYQPRVPADLGYYDLRLPIIREQQAQLAREAGIEGFMYWHYWFGNGKTLMADIFQEVLETGKPDFPFCLGWGNHDWSRKTWNSDAQYQKDQMLMKQMYPGEEDIVDHFYNVLPAFKDKRYIKVDGKPFFGIYDPFAIPSPKKFIEIWNQEAIKNGLKGIHFVSIAGGWRKNYQRVLDLGFDAIMPDGRWGAETAIDGYFMKMLKTKLRKYFLRIAPLHKYKYKDIVKYFYDEYDSKEYCYPSLVPNWDRTARAARNAQIYVGSTPALFKKMVLLALEKIRNKQPEHQILLLRSWNEWAEGNYMEPDLKFGHGYLDALREALDSCSTE